MFRSIALLLVLSTCSTPVAAVIIGHGDVDGVSSLPLSLMDLVGEQRWLFTHASVGANMIDGMQVLRTEDAARYQFVFQTAGDWNQVYPPPSPTVPGTIYDGARGNPGWAAKFAMFDAAVRNLGWRFPVIDAAMDKLCYIDPEADVSVYLAMMTALEEDFPETEFVYMTMPLQSGSNMDWSNMLAMAYNQAVRAHCAGAGRVLLDVADIESHDPYGNPITFTSGGQVYQRMWSGYTNDGGHLNALGARRVALGWYAAGAAIVGSAGGVESKPEPSALELSILPNPSREEALVRFRLDRSGPIELAIFDLQGRQVIALVDGRLPSGHHTVRWRGCDATGRAAPAGCYLVRLRGENLLRLKRLVWIP